MPRWRGNVEVDQFRNEEVVYLLQEWQFNLRSMAHMAVECKVCGSENLSRFGRTPKGAQRFICKQCGRTFVDNNAPPGMRFPTEVIASTLNQFYESASLHKIRRVVKMDFGYEPDVSAIYRWIVRYTRIAVKTLDNVPVQVGDVWVADETVIKSKDDGNLWLFDCIDEDTRFLLASHLTRSRFTRDAQTLMERAHKRANKAPQIILTDKLRAYLDGIEQVFDSDAEHIQSGPFVRDRKGDSTRAIERMHGIIKDRTRVMRALANRETAKLVMDGWFVHYNFFRPHQGLKGKTPAEAAGVKDAPFKSWKDVVMVGEGRD